MQLFSGNDQTATLGILNQLTAVGMLAPHLPRRREGETSSSSGSRREVSVSGVCAPGCLRVVSHHVSYVSYVIFNLADQPGFANPNTYPWRANYFLAKVFQKMFIQKLVVRPTFPIKNVSEKNAPNNVRKRFLSRNNVTQHVSENQKHFSLFCPSIPEGQALLR